MSISSTAPKYRNRNKICVECQKLQGLTPPVHEKKYVLFAFYGADNENLDYTCEIMDVSGVLVDGRCKELEVGYDVLLRRNFHVNKALVIAISNDPVFLQENFEKLIQNYKTNLIVMTDEEKIAKDLEYQRFSIEEEIQKLELAKQALINQLAHVTAEQVKQKMRLSNRYSNFPSETSDGMVVLGPGGTKITKEAYNKICWFSMPMATRHLMSILFSREYLRSRSMLNGELSQRDVKFGFELELQLDPVIVNDIITTIHAKTAKAEPLIREVIRTRCAKEYRLLLNQPGHQEEKKEE